MEIPEKLDPRVNRFLRSFFTYQSINRDFYALLTEEQFDYRMVKTDKIKSDSPRESLAHQINVLRAYIASAKSGEMVMGNNYDPTLKNCSKNELLGEWENIDKKMVEFLSNPRNLEKKVKVKYAPEPIPVMRYFLNLIDHECLHTGWNIALMEHLGIPRFPSLTRVWG